MNTRTNSIISERTDDAKFQREPNSEEDVDDKDMIGNEKYVEIFDELEIQAERKGGRN